MEPNRDGWDPEHPDLKEAHGVPKQGGGWRGWAIAAGILGFMLAAWFLARD